MHLTFLTPEYPHPKVQHSAGIGTSIQNLASSYVDSGHQVTIFIYGQDFDETFVENNIHFVKIKNPKIKGLSWWFTRKKIEKIIYQTHQKNPIDAIEIPDWTGISAFMKFPCKTVLKLHGSDTYFCHLEKRKVKFWNQFLEKKAFNSANYIIAVSDFVGKKSNEVFKLNRKYTVIHNGINLKNFNLEKSQISNPKSQILYFGTLIRKKGVLELPLIFNLVHEKNPQTELILVGGDSGDIFTGNSSTWELMKPLFNENTLKQVVYKGKVPYSEMRNLILDADVCVFPSFAEAFPVSWLEAMAMEKSLVTSNIGWANELIENEKNGYNENPKEHQKFADKIIQLLENKELRTNIGTQARKDIKTQFSNEYIANQHLKTYAEIL